MPGAAGAELHGGRGAGGRGRHVDGGQGRSPRHARPGRRTRAQAQVRGQGSIECKFKRLGIDICIFFREKRYVHLLTARVQRLIAQKVYIDFFKIRYVILPITHIVNIK